MDVEFNAPEAPDYKEGELDTAHLHTDRNRKEPLPGPPANGRTPGSAEGERDPDEQSR